MERGKTDEVLQHMQDAIEAPPPTICEAIEEAEKRGIYTHEEAKLYMDAYIRCFNKSRELYPDK